MKVSSWLSISAVFLGACAAEGPGDKPGPAPRAPAPSLVSSEPGASSVGLPSEGGSGDLLLGTIAGEELMAGDLIQAWHGLSSRDLWIVVDKLVATRLARAEAGRLGVVLEPERVEQEVAREFGRLEEEIHAKAPGVGIEDFIAGRLGVDPPRYFAELREASIERMLTERVARAWVLSQESRTVRLVVVRAEDAPAVEADLEAGVDLGEIARERSLDDTGKRGGLVPFLVNSEGSVLAQAAFGASPGELVGPLVNDDLRLFLRVETVTPPRSGDWSQIGVAVEESLAEIPLGDSEYVPWKLAMERSWPIDLEPLGNLVGAAR